MNLIISIQKIMKFFVLYVFAFYIFFTPDLEIIGMPKVSTMLVILAFANICMLNKSLFRNIKVDRFFYLFFVNGFIIFYLLFLDIINNVEFQYSVILNIGLEIQLINVYCLYIYLNNKGFSAIDMIVFLIRIGMIQAVICILMIIFPEFKLIANVLYFSGNELMEMKNSFIVDSRIYGISSDYTFSSQIFMGLLASLSLIISVNYKKIWIGLYCPILLFGAILNGRTGLYCFIISMVLTLPVLFSRKYGTIKAFLYAASFIVIGGIALFCLNESLPDKFKWINIGMKEVGLSIFSGENEGNMGALAESMIFIPEGWNIIFGTGYRVFGDIGMMFEGTVSDIGYINDLFKGGLIYIITFYTAIVFFVLDKTLNDTLLSRLSTTVFICFLLIGNYKGEVLYGSVFEGIVFMKLALINGSIKQISKE